MLHLVVLAQHGGNNAAPIRLWATQVRISDRAPGEGVVVGVVAEKPQRFQVPGKVICNKALPEDGVRS